MDINCREFARYVEGDEGRIGKQCRERWHNHLRDGVVKDPWKPEEFWMLSLCVRAIGRKWSLISQYLPQRSDNTIKNQWNCKMKPYKDKFNEEINMLLESEEKWENLPEAEKKLLKMIKRNGNQ